MIHIPFHIPHYFKSRISVQLEELYITAALMDFAGSAIALFEPIWLWTLGYNIQHIMLFYLLVYVPYFFLAPLGGKFVARFGPEKSIAISTGWLVAYFFGLITIKNEAILFFFVPLLFALQKSFYWPAYHFDFMRSSIRSERGSEFSGLWTVTTVMQVLGPIVGGIVVKFFGFVPLFAGAALLILISSTPLFIRRAPPKIEAFSYWKSLTLPFRRRYIKNTLGYLALGEELIGMTVWSVFILLIFKDLFNLGLLVGLGAFITSMVTLAAGKWSERFSKTKILLVTGIFQSANWLLRTIVRAPVPVFTLHTSGAAAHSTTFVAMTALTYERAHEDDYSWHGVMYEQGFALAKSLAAAAVILLAMNFDPFHAAFTLAGALSLLYLVF